MGYFLKEINHYLEMLIYCLPILLPKEENLQVSVHETAMGY